MTLLPVPPSPGGQGPERQKKGQPKRGGLLGDAVLCAREQGQGSRQARRPAGLGVWGQWDRRGGLGRLTRLRASAVGSRLQRGGSQAFRGSMSLLKTPHSPTSVWGPLPVKTNTTTFLLPAPLQRESERAS